MRMNKKPKVVMFFDHTAQLSGGEISMLQLTAHLDRARWTPVVVLASEGPLQEKLESAGVETYVFPLRTSVVQARKDTLGAKSLLRLGDALATLRYSLHLARFIRRRRVALVHTNSLKADLIGGVAARWARVPLIWHIRDRIASDYLPARVVWVFRALSRLVPQTVLANSHATLQTLKLPDSKDAHVLHQGIVDRPIDIKPVLQNDTPRIGIVGRISSWKGQHIFLRAAARIREAFPNARFLIIGAALFEEADYEREVHALSTSLGLAECVEWTGFRSDIADVIETLDIQVHASTVGEPYGRVIIEAMQAAKPVVATNGGGVPEIMIDGETGLLIPMNDSDALAEAVLSLLRDPERAREMGYRGRLHVLEHFTIEKTVSRLAAIYDATARHKNIR